MVVQAVSTLQASHMLARGRLHVEIEETTSSRNFSIRRLTA